MASLVLESEWRPKKVLLERSISALTGERSSMEGKKKEHEDQWILVSVESNRTAVPDEESEYLE